MPITLNITLTRSDIFRSSLFAQFILQFPSFLFFVLIVFFLQIFFWIWWWTTPTYLDIIALLIVDSWGLAIIFTIFSFSSLKRQIETTKSMLEESEWIFYDNRVFINLPFSKWEYAYEQFWKIMESRLYFIFAINSSMYIFLPKKYLKKTEIENLKWILENNPQYKHLNY